MVIDCRIETEIERAPCLITSPRSHVICSPLNALSRASPGHRSMTQISIR